MVWNMETSNLHIRKAMKTTVKQSNFAHTYKNDDNSSIFSLNNVVC